jgi:hypothetical protein
MKRILTTLLIFCFVLCLLPVSAFAATGTYDLDELGMSIELPSDHVVFTRDIKANDPNLSAYGLTKDGLSSLMQERSIYLNAWDEDINYEIIITMMDSPLADYNLLSDTTLAAVVSSFETEYAGAGITFIRSDIYQHSQAKFAKIYISQPNNGETAYGLQYNTVYNDKAINITMQSYSGKIDSNKESILKKIVDTVHFDTDPQLNPPPTQTEAFTYTDPTSGMTFTVPANWVEEPMFKEREFIDVKFVSNLEEGLAIIFASEDMLSDGFLEESGVSGFEKLLVSRSNLDNSMLTKADVAAMYGESESAVSMVTYGNKEYFIYETVQSGSAYGVTVKVPMTILVRCENGFMYMFQFCGTKDNPYFADFEKLVNSVKYPVFEDDEVVRDQVLGSYLLLAIIVLIALILIIVFVCRSAIKKKAIKKKPQVTPTIAEESTVRATPEASQVKAEEVLPPEPPTKELEPEPTPEPLVETTEPAVSFCHRCGNKLMSGSLFCNKCGTKIPTTKE